MSFDTRQLDKGDAKYSRIAREAVENLYQTPQKDYCLEPATQECEHTDENVGDQEYDGGAEAKFRTYGDRFVNDEMDKG